MQPSPSRTPTPYWLQLASVTSSSSHQCHLPELLDIKPKRSLHHLRPHRAATLSSEDLNFTSAWCASRKNPEEDPQVITSRTTTSSLQPEIINNITREELTSPNEYDIKNENQEEIELTSNGHHHVPRHQIVYNIFGQPHLECFENTSSGRMGSSWRIFRRRVAF